MTLAGVRFEQVLDLVRTVIWPLALVGVFWFLFGTAAGKRVIRTILGSLRRVKAGGVEIELNAEVAGENKASLEDTFAEYRAAIQREFDRLVRAHKVKSLHNRLAERVVAPVVNGEWRSTIFVADVLFAAALYRLVDYFPKGRGRGSVYSVRYGIIGKAWRLERDVPPEQVDANVETLISGWGMMRDEAIHAAQESSRQSFACAILEHGGAPVGLFYVDHKDPDGLPPNLVESIKESDDFTHLATAVAKVTSEIGGLGPQLGIFEDS